MCLIFHRNSCNGTTNLVLIINSSFESAQPYMRPNFDENIVQLRKLLTDLTWWFIVLSIS